MAPQIISTRHNLLNTTRPRDARTTNGAALPLLHSPHSPTNSGMRKWGGRGRGRMGSASVSDAYLFYLSHHLFISSRQPNEHRAVQCAKERKKERKKESVTVENAVKTFLQRPTLFWAVELYQIRELMLGPCHASFICADPRE